MSKSPSCIGCGYCCTSVICRIGAMIYGYYTNPCPSLKRIEGRYVCLLYMSDPERYSEILAIGDGCSFPLNPLREHLSKRLNGDPDKKHCR